jgi:transposase, IS5 family
MPPSVNWGPIEKIVQ